jgi:phage baseplate assembly protein W
MNGLDKNNGTPISNLAHLQQSVADILTTPIGTRLMRRDYGSTLFDLIDQPANGATLVRVFAATASALMKWEPRIKVKKISIAAHEKAGKWQLTISGIVDQQHVNLNVAI